MPKVNDKSKIDVNNAGQRSSLSRYQYNFITSAAVTEIAGIVHLLMSLYIVPPMMQWFATRPGNAIFYLGSVFWDIQYCGKPRSS